MRLKAGSHGWWAMVVAYAVVLLTMQSGLGVAVDAFKDRWGTGALETTMTVGVALGGLFLAGGLFLVWRGCTGAERAWMVAMLVLYGAGTLSLAIPQERLHYLQYGLLAALVYMGSVADASNAELAPRRLLAREYGGPLRRGVLVAVVAAAGLGLVDEILQGWLWPRRYFDWRDVQLNLQAALLGVAIAVPAFAGWRRRL